MNTLDYTQPQVGFALKKGAYMIVRGDMPSDIDPVAEVTDQDGLGFALRQIDEGDITLSFDYTVAWITIRTYAAFHAHAFADKAQKALLKAGIDVTSATGFAHHHLFVARDKAPHAMEILHETHDAVRTRENLLESLIAIGSSAATASSETEALTQEFLNQSSDKGRSIDPMPTDAVAILQRINTKPTLSP